MYNCFSCFLGRIEDTTISLGRFLNFIVWFTTSCNQTGCNWKDLNCDQNKSCLNTYLWFINAITMFSELVCFCYGWKRNLDCSNFRKLLNFNFSNQDPIMWKSNEWIHFCMHIKEKNRRQKCRKDLPFLCSKVHTYYITLQL